MSYLSQKLKSLRFHYNYTQKEVAESIGVSQGTYSSLESGKTNPSLDTLIKLAHFYNEYIETLVGTLRVVDDYELTEQEKILMRKFRRLSPREQCEIEVLIDFKIDKARVALDSEEE